MVFETINKRVFRLSLDCKPMFSVAEIIPKIGMPVARDTWLLEVTTGLIWLNKKESPKPTAIPKKVMPEYNNIRLGPAGFNGTNGGSITLKLTLLVNSSAD